MWLSAREGGQPMKSKISVGDQATLASEIATLAEATLQISRAGGVCSMAPSRRRASAVTC